MVLNTYSQAFLQLDTATPLSRETPFAVVYLHKVADDDVDFFLFVYHIRLGASQARLHEVSRTRHNDNQREHIDDLPQDFANIQIDAGYAYQEEYNVKQLGLTRQIAIPGQRVFQRQGYCGNDD
jgi:hypothetical protein